MTPSPLIDDRTRTNRSRRRSTGNALALAPGCNFSPPSHRKRRAARIGRHANRRTPQQNDRTKPFNPNSLS